MYTVLDLHYTKDKGQECFSGNYEECLEFIRQQGACSFMYEIIN